MSSATTLPNGRPNRNYDSSYIGSERGLFNERYLKDQFWRDYFQSNVHNSDDRQSANDSLLAYYLQLAAESRSNAYNDPSAQLYRLMRAGMSREAALQAIGIIGSSASASPVQSSPFAMEEDVNRTAIDQADQSMELQRLGFLYSTVGSVMSFASSGLGVLKGFQDFQVGQFNLQNASHNQQALQAASSLGAAIQNNFAPDGSVIPDSQLPTSDDWQSYQSLLNFVQNTDNPNIVNWRNNNPGAMDIPYFFEYIHNLYRNNISDRGFKELEDEAEYFSKILQYQSLQAKLNYDIDFLNYNWNFDNYEDYSLTRGVVNDITLQNFKNELEILTNISDPDMLQYKIDKLRNDAEFESLVSFFNNQRQKYVNGMYDNDPVTRQIMNTCAILDQYGFGGSEVGTAVKAAHIAADIFGNDDASSALSNKITNAAGNAIDVLSSSTKEINSRIKNRIIDLRDRISNRYKYNSAGRKF